MSALSGAVSSSKLARKQLKAKKVIERSEQVTSGNSLSSFHEITRKAKSAYDQILSDQNQGVSAKLTNLRRKGKENRAVQKELRAELERATKTSNIQPSRSTRSYAEIETLFGNSPAPI